MKSKILILFVTVNFAAFHAQAQRILTLKECYQNALASTSLAGEKDAYASIWQLNEKNLSKGWLPSLDANGSFIYNSSVVDIGSAFGSLPFPVKSLPHEQYKVTLDINQVIYDGGVIKSSKNLEKANLGINQKQTETDLYKLRSQINVYYFNLLLLGRQKDLLNDYLQLLDRQIQSMQSALNNGMATRSDIDVVTSERIKISQEIDENEIIKASLLKNLSDLTGSVIDSSFRLVLPAVAFDKDQKLSRPEVEMFDLRKDQLTAGLKLTESKRMPKAFGFATLGYGNPPGNNFFKDEFAPYYIVGAGIKWNIYDWNKTKNEIQSIRLQQGIIENRKSELEDNLSRMLTAKNAEIESLGSQMSSDTTLISIRKRITASAESKYDNGTITATELLNEMNSEQQAIINYEIHRINYVMAQVEYLNISGKEIE
ncbi:MAG: TolC family protein [Bacteroidota bacterium]|nr:TolC family protein [Bacteroidota bacterium]